MYYDLIAATLSQYALSNGSLREAVAGLASGAIQTIPGLLEARAADKRIKALSPKLNQGLSEQQNRLSELNNKIMRLQMVKAKADIIREREHSKSSIRHHFAGKPFAPGSNTELMWSSEADTNAYEDMQMLENEYEANVVLAKHNALSRKFSIMNSLALMYKPPINMSQLYLKKSFLSPIVNNAIANMATKFGEVAYDSLSSIG